MGCKKFCDWSKLPNYTKNGKILLEVTIQVEPESLVGGDPTSYYQHFLVEQPGINNRVLLVSGIRIYVIREVSVFIF